MDTSSDSDSDSNSNSKFSVTSGSCDENSSCDEEDDDEVSDAHVNIRIHLAGYTLYDTILNESNSGLEQAAKDRLESIIKREFSDGKEYKVNDFTKEFLTEEIKNYCITELCTELLNILRPRGHSQDEYNRLLSCLQFEK